ncbi:hypothetical protein [Sphingomonas carotinifaciens]|uniref:hypothetical protein n=1 Tax=Sphingomonas carotinifaciens TaxID=1166323 RepID=UPI0012375805|nr:hypothetical protein [Sphingomonas carotinifaciens]
MKIGMEQDPIEDLDREEERVIAAAVHARFSGGDLKAALREFDRLAVTRMAMHRKVTSLCA